MKIFLWFHSRRQIHWSELRGLRRWCAFFIATFLGIGLLPLAPGTFGSLAALPIAKLCSEWELFTRFVVCGLLLLVGSWGAQIFDEMMGTADNQNIVIDEVIGVIIASWTTAGHWTSLIAAFLFFRIFDIFKLPPVRQLDQWSRQKAKTPFFKGLGVIADDVVAGLQALFVIIVLQYFSVLP